MIAKVIIVAAIAVASLAESYVVPSNGYGRLDDYKYPPRPYDVGYETIDGYGTTTFRKESGDGNGIVQGSYGYRDDKGIERVVDYVADEKGFRAQVKTNEPGTERQNPADVLMLASPVVVDYVPQKYAPQPSYSAPRSVYAAPRSAYGVPRSLNVAPGLVYDAPRPVDPRLPYGLSRLPYDASGASSVANKGALIASDGAVGAADTGLY